MNERPSGRSQWIVAALLAVAAVALAWVHVREVQFFCDDSYISFRYAQNLADGHGLVYNVGERVEGYTNFLWVMLLALGAALGFALETWSLVTGLVLLAATGFLTFVLTRRLLGSAGFAAVTLPLLAALGPMILWSSSGLESVCFAAMIVAALVAYERAANARGLLVSGALYALATMVRPDGVVFGFAAGVHLILAAILRRDAVGTLLKNAGALAGGFVAVFGPFLMWRVAYYDDWLPNTFYVKSGSPIQMPLGFQYLEAFLQDYPALWLLTVAGVGIGLGSARYRAVRGSLVHLVMAMACFALYIAWAGGDYMALYRFMVPLLPIAALFCALFLQFAFEGACARVLDRPPVWTAAGLVLLAGVCWWSYQPSVRSTEGGETDEISLLHPVSNMRRNSSLWKQAGLMLNAKLWPDASIATTAAGALPFFAGCRTLDQSGLCDRTIAKEESDPWLLDRPGHMKQATRAYLGRQRPDLIIWHPTIKESGWMFRAMPPSEEYVPRAWKVDGLLDNEGRQQYLYFFLRKDRLRLGESLGILDPNDPKAVW